jgi:hypothetical protein
MPCVNSSKSITQERHPLIFASHLEQFEFCRSVKEISTFLRVAWQELGCEPSIFYVHPKVCASISFLLKNHKHTNSIWLLSDDYLEICEKASSSAGTNCANFQVSKSKEKRCPLFVCQSCEKEFKAETRRKRNTVISTMSGKKAKRQDPSSSARFDQLSPESKTPDSKGSLKITRKPI